MTLQQLKYVIALDDYRHFVTAAEKCFVSQPTLTLQIKKLETELGVALFDRSKHPIEPTPMGERLILKARQILHDVDEFNSLVSDDKKKLKGEFRIGIIPTVAPYLLPLFLGDFIKKNPETKLVVEEMQSEAILNALHQNSLDIGLLVTPLNDKNIREVPVFKEPFLLYASETSPFYQQEKIEHNTINQEGLLLLKRGHCFRNQILNICNEETLNLNKNFKHESGSIETLKNMVRSHLGYTLVPELSVMSELEQNSPMVKRFCEPQPVREVSLVVNRGFSKEKLLENIFSSIRATLPSQIKQTDNYIRVKWR